MIDTFEDTLKRAKKVVFLTGAGISQESGISTFRRKDGLWQKYDPMKLASAQAFRDNPKLVWSRVIHTNLVIGYVGERGFVVPDENKMMDEQGDTTVM
jgi:NAD-dependent SIR2 family protein deacetylase